MDDEIEVGNAAIPDGKTGYIVGDCFEELSQLPGVLTVKQFFKALFENNLPRYASWIVGQGINASIRYVLYLCEQYSSAVHFQFVLPQAGELCSSAYTTWEWHHVHFTNATRLEAELRLVEGCTKSVFTQDFIFSAARELTERGCELALPQSLLVIKNAQLNSFHRLFPLPIRVEVQFHLLNDNKRTIKSTVRFYQDMHCAAEVTLQCDVYSEEESRDFIYKLGEKTFGSFSRHVDEEGC